MSTAEYWICDQCSKQSDTPMVYRLAQITDELDDDLEPVTATFDFCTTACLHSFSMDMALDFEDVPAPE